MILKENSDITDVAYGLIAHGVNCQHVMGSGVARALYSVYPEVREEYLNLNSHSLGDVQLVAVSAFVTVANCHTQEHYGRDNKIYADIVALRKCLIQLAEMSNLINIPKIGCGLGGLIWKDVERIIVDIESTYSCVFIVHVR